MGEQPEPLAGVSFCNVKHIRQIASRFVPSSQVMQGLCFPEKAHPDPKRGVEGFNQRVHFFGQSKRLFRFAADQHGP